ncbi:hypothetical protein [Microbacterium sp. K24]|uniref:hypothetical protein n=1 Tax=Microbacterium sp. K24 TaxID=2305446 RepID=UPI00109CFD8E|nr:hypothetical protein [Microbacterium sp. K24]
MATTHRSEEQDACRFCHGKLSIIVSRDPDEEVDCVCTDKMDAAVVEQIAMFTQKHDAIRYGSVVDGVAHPTWAELGPDAAEEYLADAERTVRAMVALGWGPRRG